MMNTRLLVPLVLVICALIPAGCGGGDSGTTSQATQTQTQAQTQTTPTNPSQSAGQGQTPKAKKVKPSPAEADISTKPKVPKGKGAPPTSLVSNVNYTRRATLKDPEFFGGSEARFRPGVRRCSSYGSPEEVLRGVA